VQRQDAGATGTSTSDGGSGDAARRTPWWGSGFDVVKRGYDRAQVEEALDHAQADLQIMTTDRDAMVRAEEQARAEVRTLQAEVDRLASAPLSLEGLSTRLANLLRLAQEEAVQIRDEAAADARAITEDARQRARRTVDDAVARADGITADAEQRSRARLADAAEEATAIVAGAESQARALRRDAESARDELRRHGEELEAEQRELVERTRAEVERLGAEAAAERARRDEDADTRRRRLEEDLDTALATRRAESDAALADAEDRRRRAEERARSVEQEAAARLDEATATATELEEHRRRVTTQMAELRRSLDLPGLDEPAVRTASTSPAPTLVTAGGESGAA
jgi:cell division septum initiation protein DivIVA